MLSLVWETGKAQGKLTSKTNAVAHFFLAATVPGVHRSKTHLEWPQGAERVVCVDMLRC